MTTTAAADFGTSTQVQRPKSKAIRCPSCGYVNVVESKFYFWLISKEKDLRCRGCGRTIRLPS